MTIFNAKHVTFAGLVLSVSLGSLMLHGGHRTGFLIAVAVMVLDLFFPSLFGFVKGFAEQNTWPTFVAAGVAILFAAHAGGWSAVLGCCGPLTTLDGMYWYYNY